MLELVRYQKEEREKTNDEEYTVLSSTRMLVSEKNRHGELGKCIDCITHDFSIQKRK